MPSPHHRHHHRLVLLAFLVALLRGAAAAEDERGGAVRVWCVAKNDAEDGALQNALDWACGPSGGGVDCSAVQDGGACFDPDVLQFHASYAFNEYYSRRPSNPLSCDFSGTAALTQLDPVGSISGVNPNCKFPASLSVSNGTFDGSTSDISAGPNGYDSNGMGRGQLDHRWAFWATILLLPVATSLLCGAYNFRL